MNDNEKQKPQYIPYSPDYLRPGGMRIPESEIELLNKLMTPESKVSETKVITYDKAKDENVRATKYIPVKERFNADLTSAFNNPQEIEIVRLGHILGGINQFIGERLAIDLNPIIDSNVDIASMVSITSKGREGNMAKLLRTQYGFTEGKTEQITRQMEEKKKGWFG